MPLLTEKEEARVQDGGSQSMEKKDIRSYGYTELKKEMAHLGEKAFRAKQV